jgi:glycosidase
VRTSLVNHLNDILSLGAAGFRFDAAKHVPIADLQNIYSRLSKTPYVVSEVSKDASTESIHTESGVGRRQRRSDPAFGLHSAWHSHRNAVVHSAHECVHGQRWPNLAQ